jgi:NADPH:quinone reductase-like Zn-dependent oxidoreductase
MKAYVYRRYGGPEVLELVEVNKPVPEDNEILVKIRATTVTTGDWRARSLRMPRGLGPIARLVFGIMRPKRPILGTEYSGIVEAVGKDVTTFSPGDAVFGFPGGRMGCHAQYCVVAVNGPVAPKPEHLSFEDAASLSFGGTTALHFVRKAGVKPGDRMLVIGASGGVGTALVQLAKHMGAKVTGVASSANLELVSSLGADRVIAASGEAWDIVADTVGATSYARCRQVLKDVGHFLAIAGA